MSPSMLARWRGCKNEHRAYVTFLEWLEKTKVLELPATADRLALEYLEIDPEQLEAERRALLEEPQEGAVKP